MKPFIAHYNIKCKVLKSNGYSKLVELTEDITVYKQLNNMYTLEAAIATLFIPAGTVIHIPSVYDRDSVNTRKCRAEFAIVTNISNKYNDFLNDSGMGYATKLEYVKNEFVFPDKFSKNLGFCKNGIHFFFSKEDAKRY